MKSTMTLSREVEEGARSFYTGILVTLASVALSVFATAYDGRLPRLVLISSIAALIIALLAIGLTWLNMPRTKVTYAFDTRIYVNQREGLILPSPSPHYLLQNYAHQLYRLLDKCNLVDRGELKKIPDVAEMIKGKLGLVTTLFEEALLRSITNCSHECLHYHGGKVVDLDLATIVKPRITVTLNNTREKCGIKGADAALLWIPIHLPKSFDVNIEKVGRPGSLFEVTIKSRYCSLKSE
jgi:hypothetical protein